MCRVDLTLFYRCVHSRLPRQFSARIHRGRYSCFHSIERRCKGWSMILGRQTAALCSVAWPIDLCCLCPRESRPQLSSIGLRSPSCLHGKLRFSNLTAVFGRPSTVSLMQKTARSYGRHTVWICAPGSRMSGGQAGSSSKEPLAASHRNGLFSGGSEDKPCWRVVAASCLAAQCGERK